MSVEIIQFFVYVSRLARRFESLIKNHINIFFIAPIQEKHNMEELNFRVVLLFLILYNVIKGDEKMFEKHFNRSYETHDFPYFVPEKESLATRYLKP